MAKTLIIAEKPSVAADIARALGGFKKSGDFFENEEYVICSAVGHVAELCMPEDYDKKLKFWALKSLPIIPEKFNLKPSERTAERFELLKRLMKRADVKQLLNACDAGREGELIFTYLYELAGCKKPFRRLWWSSMTKEAIRDAFTHTRPAEDMLKLQQAARCRSESDWLIGINGTRALTTRMYGHRAGAVATVGRVQTPTLSMVMDREIEIRHFVPRDYWRIVARFGIAQGEYEGVYQRPDFKKADDEDRADRVWDKALAERIYKEVAQPSNTPQALVTEEKKRSTQIAPRLYDLTTLQREANTRFGLPAGKTLSLAQALYEKHKAITYPRTDARALPEDYASTVQRVLTRLGGELVPHAAKVIENRWVNPASKRVFNNAEVSDHFAIIPTDEPPEKLSPDEAKIFDMISRRFVAVFYPVAEFDITTRTSIVGEHAFKTEGKVLAVPGWLEVYGKHAGAEENLPALSPPDGQPPKAKLAEAQMIGEATKPPPRYTEATLLAAMEGAGKLVEDEDLADAMKEKGLGTPATRAAIIEHLIALHYMERMQRELVPTPKAESLMDFLKLIKIEELTSPDLTGEWEWQLRRLEEGKTTRDKFMSGISDLTKKIVDRTRKFNEENVPTKPTDIVNPGDGKTMLETWRAYKSQDGTTTVYKIIGNRRLAVDEVRELLTKRQIGPLDGFRSKKGRPFSAMLKLDEENKVKFVFENSGLGGNGDNGGAPVDLSQFPVVGKCPACGGAVHETPNSYMCAQYGQGDDAKCKFRISRTLLGATIVREQFQKLVEHKKTDLIKGFRSKRTNRLFDAFLILKDKSGIGFEFPPRKPRAAGGPKSKMKKSAKTGNTPPPVAPAAEAAPVAE